MSRRARPFRAVPLVTLLVLASGLIAIHPSAAQAACDPFTSPASFLGETPTAQQVLGFPLGDHEVTSQESDAYLDAVDQASDRVVSGTAAMSWQGRPLRYAIVGSPENVTTAGLADVRAAIDALRDPATPGPQAAALAASTPAILLMQANVHGGEESGTEAALRILYELADRDDCVSDTILDDAIVLILPIQNPDGREADTRRNAYDIDMNRDWFARTQPETDGKLQLYRQYPPVLDLDVHEMGAYTYFFPPNSDPVYHEIADVSNDWINGLYGPAMAAEFKRQKIRFFNYEPYDFFGTFYGDTVPTVGFHSAGMTFEKQSTDPLPVRMYEQYVTSLTSIFAAASHKEQILQDWHASWVRAYQEGVAGTLEPNAVFQTGHHVIEQVPTGSVVRHYFVLQDAGKAYEVQRLIRRLQRMDVVVKQLTAPLSVPSFRAYGRPAHAMTLPVGTYWIPMAQARKHWVQSMLNEDTYIPHDVTYDVTGWSNPLLMNVPAGFTGANVSPQGQPAPALGEPAWPFGVSGAPDVAVFDGPGATALESRGAVRWLFDQVWHLPFDLVSSADIAAGGLAGHDVLVMPDGYANSALQALGAKGKKALVSWVNGGGHLIAWEGSAEVATRTGASTAVLQPSHTNMPGSLVRIQLDGTSPLAAGVGPSAWAMYEDDPVMTPGRGITAASFPAAGTQDFFVSGLDVGATQLGGTTALADEAVGAGRSTVFTFDPVFRGWADGTERLLWNAIMGDDPFPGAAAAAGSAARSAAERTALDAALALPQVRAPFRLTVASTDAALTADVLASLGARWERGRGAKGALFLIDNPRELTAEEHPFIGNLAGVLKGNGIRVRSLALR